MKTSDWTRLLPRPRGSPDRDRMTYLVEFLLHRRGSEASKQKAIKEIENLPRCGESETTGEFALRNAKIVLLPKKRIDGNQASE